MINARGETVHEKRSFKQAFTQRRCLIPADGYFEWKKETDGKQPYLIHADDEVVAMAGLWEENKRLGTDQSPLISCTIITTEANETTSTVHDRMPVFLKQDDFELWLDPGFRDTESLREMLRPADNDTFNLKPVSKYVNNARHEGPECLQS